MLIGSADTSGKSIGGQYEKTRLVYNFLKKEQDVCVDFCNMFDIGKTFRLVFRVIKGYFSSDCVVVITSTRGTRIISKLLYCLYKIQRRVIVYLVVGNQQELLRSLSDKVRKSIKKLYFEVDSMQYELKNKYEVGFFSNCKDVHLQKKNKEILKPIKICYYSEISFRKGFDRIIRALDVINQPEMKYRLDVYGFYAADKKDMEKYLASRDYLNFLGTIRREESADILSQYSFMVFPSRHKLEGVPGAIVDAYEAGLPVVCANVGFLSEVVRDKKTGYCFNDENELISLLGDIYDNTEMLKQLTDNVYDEIEKYDIKTSIKRLHKDLIDMLSDSAHGERKGISGASKDSKGNNNADNLQI